MVGVVGVERAQHADVVDVGGQPGQQFADFHAALPAAPELERHRHQPSGRPLRAQVDRLGPLPRVPVDGRLRIEQVGPKRAAIHEQVNDPPGTGPEVRLAGCGVRGKQAGQPENSQTAAERLDHFTPGDNGVRP